MFFGQFSEVLRIDVTLFVAFDHLHLQAGHHCTGRIGTVGRSRNQHHLALMISPILDGRPGI